MKKKVEYCRPLFFEQEQLSAKLTKQEQREREKAEKRQRRKIRRRNFAYACGELMLRVFVSLIITAVVTIAVSVLVTAVQKDISLVAAFQTLLDKVREWLS